MPLHRARRALATASTVTFVVLATAPAYAAGSKRPEFCSAARSFCRVGAEEARTIEVNQMAWIVSQPNLCLP